MAATPALTAMAVSTLLIAGGVVLDEDDPPLLDLWMCGQGWRDAIVCEGIDGGGDPGLSVNTAFKFSSLKSSADYLICNDQI